MGKGAQQVAKRDEQHSADDAWIEKMDLAGFRDEIRALGKELEAGQGPADAAHLRKLMMWTDTCGIVALATLWEKGFFDATIGRVVRSDEEALKWYEHAANQGHPPSQKRFKALFATLNFAPGYEPAGGLAVEDIPDEGPDPYDVGAEGGSVNDY